LSLYGTVAVAALLSDGAASACLPASLRASKVKAVLTAGTVPAQILALTEGVMKAMLLTILKITACFAMLMLLADVGATGLTYWAAAQEPKRESGYLAPVTSRPQADDLESLRLEMEALRKELRATRERVKTLEDEVRTLKGQGGTRRPGGGAGSRGGPPTAGLGSGGPGDGGPFGSSSGIPSGSSSGIGGAGGTTASPEGPKRLETPSDPVADAEAALKRLRQDPSDKGAADELERALKALKEREKSRPPTEVVIKGK
jgi:hypothetical protein